MTREREREREMVLLMYCWILFAAIFWMTSAFMFTGDTGQYFSFFVVSLSGFGIIMMVFGGVSSSANFWGEFQKARC